MPASLPEHSSGDQLDRLRGFRQELYGCVTRWADTLFETADALLCGPSRLESLPHLTLQPELGRGHGSVYAALAKGRIDTTALRRLLAGAIQPEFGLVFAADVSSWHRPDAVTCPDRTLNYDSSKDPGTGERVNRTTPGWAFGWLAQIGPSRQSWVTPVDLDHVGPGDNANRVAVHQIRRLLDHLAALRISGMPIVCCDAGYSPAALGALSEEQVQIVVRLRADSLLFTAPPPPPPGTPGRPRRHGPPMKLKHPDTWPEPDQTQHVPAESGRAGLTVTCWHRLHLRPSRAYHESEPDGRPAKANRRLIHGSLIQIRSDNPRHKTIWLWWTGPDGTFDLAALWRAYLRRFGIEHFFRFGKQHLAWTTPRPRTPAQAERWSWLVATAYTQLLLARHLTHTRLLPWERGHTISPHRVKRGFRTLRTELGTPTKARQNSTPGPGRPPGRPNQHKHTRYPKAKKPQG